MMALSETRLTRGLPSSSGRFVLTQHETGHSNRDDLDAPPSRLGGDGRQPTRDEHCERHVRAITPGHDPKCQIKTTYQTITAYYAPGRSHKDGQWTANLEGSTSSSAPARLERQRLPAGDCAAAQCASDRLSTDATSPLKRYPSATSLSATDLVSAA